MRVDWCSACLQNTLESTDTSPTTAAATLFCQLQKLCPTLADGTKVVLNCSGRGDKDVNTVIKALGMQP
jgi:tryptophan synthase beta subunit